jgi:DNA-binding MarR family transcriptional regulator
MNSSLTGPPRRGTHARASAADRFEAATRRCRALLGRPSPGDLSDDELALLQLLASSPAGVALSWVADQLGWAKSSTSVMVKDLDRRGLVRRARRPDDERRLAIAVTARGAARVAEDRAFDAERLGSALRTLSPTAREHLLGGLEALAAAAEGLPEPSGPPGR